MILRKTLVIAGSDVPEGLLALHMYVPNETSVKFCILEKNTPFLVQLYVVTLPIGKQEILTD